MNYLDPDLFRDQVVAFNLDPTNPTLRENLVASVALIAHGVASTVSPREDREDVAQEIVLNVLTQIHHYDPARSTNAFAFTTCLAFEAKSHWYRKRQQTARRQQEAAERYEFKHMNSLDQLILKETLDRVRTADPELYLALSDAKSYTAGGRLKLSAVARFLGVTPALVKLKVQGVRAELSGEENR